MADIIKILPDSVANQIAAGEVIQRPASVIKELVENSVDAKATRITINVKDSGRTLIQIIDNGIGMSETDARISFERHSTSKINSAEDLFSLTTKGFRGEALASIASVAHVELNTRQETANVGTQIIIEGSKLIKQEDVACSKGANFSVKNLFYNVPARRKFLKATNIELGHILTEIQRIALSHPEVAFILIHNDKEIYNLPTSNYKQRIVNIFGKQFNQNLTEIKTETSFINIYGYIGKPEIARKQYGQQFLFVNNRFFKNSYFHKAIISGYDKIIPQDAVPTYFIYFDIEPNRIDVNIHPTKTEINFENASAIFQILISAVKKTLGVNNIVPSIDFDQDGAFEIQPPKKNANIKMPEVKINENYNPFEKGNFYNDNYNNDKENLQNWEELYQKTEYQTIPSTLDQNITTDTQFFQIKNKYILTTLKSGIVIIDQKKAHEKILFEKYLSTFNRQKLDSQQTIYPQKMEFNQDDLVAFNEIMDNLIDIGFSFEQINNYTFYITGIPDLFEKENIDVILYELIANQRKTPTNIREKIYETMALSYAKNLSMNHNTPLTKEEMLQIFDSLFATKTPNYTHDGKQIIAIINYEEIEKKFES